MKHATPIVCLLALFLPTYARAANQPYNLPDGLYAEVTTPRGIVVSELFYKRVPMTVCNYVGLAEGTLGPRRGTPFFDTSTFHRVVPNFVAQGGDTQPDGEGDVDYSFPDEIVPGLRHDSAGVMQMANAGIDTNGSQWCFMLAPAQRLNYNHTVFGHVVRGMEVLPLIQRGDTMKVKILRLGDGAIAFKADQETFNVLIAKARKYDGPREPGPGAFFDDPDKILPTDIPRASDFNRKLGNFLRFTGTRIIGRMYAKTPDGAQNEKLNAFLVARAEKFGVADKGALAVYFGDTDRWHIHIGKESVADFIAGTRKANGTKSPVPANKTLNQAMTDFLGTVKTQVPMLIDAFRATTRPTTGQNLTPGQKIKFQVDAVLDNLIFHLEPE